MLGEIGTLEWARRTDGLLSRAERARYVAATLATTSKALPLLAAHRAGLLRGRSVLASLDAPDSRLARDTVAECEELMEPVLMEHNWRSFLYARVLADGEGAKLDEELLLVATMYHDSGLAGDGPGDRCFTLVGAERAERRMSDGASTDRASKAAEAITLHINPSVGPERGAEARFMHDGILLDATGLLAWKLDRGTIRGVREAHPRLRFSQVAGELFRGHGRAVPRCRAAAAWTAGFGLGLRVSWRN